jgi:hypothetical protein
VQALVEELELYTISDMATSCKTNAFIHRVESSRTMDHALRVYYQKNIYTSSLWTGYGGYLSGYNPGRANQQLNNQNALLL